MFEKIFNDRIDFPVIGALLSRASVSRLIGVKLRNFRLVVKMSS